MNKTLLFIALLLIANAALWAQETFPVNGPHNKNHNYYAFINAQVHTDYQTVIDKGTLLIKDGIIISVGAQVNVPKEAIVYDLKGKAIYPSLIDMYTSYGMPEIKVREGRNPAPQIESKTPGAYNWNQAIKPEVDAAKLFIADAKSAEELRKLGFGSVLTLIRDGIARGSSAFVTLAEAKENNTIILDKAAAQFSFEKGSSTQDYPSALMGAIALLRQSYIDAQWYSRNTSKREYNISLDAWNKLQTLPQIIEAKDKLNALRADKVGDEFNVQYIIKGAGDEYQRIDEMKNTNARFIIPLNFPETVDVEDPYDASLIEFDDLKHWEMAPLNPSALEKKGIAFALTTADLKDKKDFFKNIRKAIQYGLTEKQALKALTVTPAEMLGLTAKIGALKNGLFANFIITSGNIFDEKTIIYENWIQGVNYKINDYTTIDVRADYKLNLSGDNKTYTLKISGEVEKPKAIIQLTDTLKTPVTLTINRNLVSISFNLKDDRNIIRLSGTVTTNPLAMAGQGQLGNGDWISWNATYLSAFTEKVVKKDSIAKKDSLAKKSYPKLEEVIYPFASYGRTKSDSLLPTNKPATVLIKNVTVWTNEQEGILKNKDVLITDGKITRIGENIAAPNGKARVVDGTGKHLTPGVIDEHSHIAISRGVNEAGQSSSAEVRIGDVLNCDDVNIYRQLAGGVVACQLLHGSANAIGGQSAIIKLRWGAAPEELKIKGADGFIKFALGENVKQSNWGEAQTLRYPQSRMGVEQVYYDHFKRAKEYQAQQEAFNKLPTDKATNYFRKDLELECLLEILNKKRFITCHSYVQSEINMLLHVADSMGFKVNTLTHILEGYKVADKMKQHGVGASTFSDWWAYKMEVKEAIPYNAALLNSMGVVTAINSDDAEMARRLNQEAAKCVKYGNVTEEDALKMITLNPAKLLHLDKHMGSIKPGKDGDVVLWSDNPLSIYAKVEKTFIEGICYYDLEADKQLRNDIRKERARLIQKILAEKSGPEPGPKPKKKEQHLYHCDDIENYGAFMIKE